jgi:hypothetical protein
MENRTRENAGRLAYAIQRHSGDEHVINRLSHLLAYNENQLKIDIEALVKVIRTIPLNSEIDFENWDDDTSEPYEIIKSERDRLQEELKTEKAKRAKAGRRPRIQPELVEEIRQLYIDGQRMADISKQTGYSIYTVSQAINGKLD